MLKHIVMFKLTDPTEENVAACVKVLRSMEDNVPTVKGIEVGADVLHSPRSYDVILQVTLESAEKLDEYQSDAYHVGVVKKHMHAVTATSVAIDYEF